MREIKKRVIPQKTNAGVAEIFYLTMLEEKNEDGSVEMKLGTRRKALTLETFQVQSKISKEQIKDLSYLHGLELDIHGMTASALENESEMMTEKLIKNIMRYAGEQHYKLTFTKIQALLNKWFSFVPKKRIVDESDIIRYLILYSNTIAKDSRLGPANYVIVSGGMSQRIMDSPQFVFNDPNQPQLDQASGFVYKIGQIGTSLEVLVDPDLKYSDQTVILGKNSQDRNEAIYYLYMDPETIKTEIVDTETLTPYELICIKRRMVVHPTDNAHLQYLTFEFTDKTHNIFTHLWSKLFKK